ncbi:MAG: IS630 family transposase [Planctomycetales bacterium]|nr:IS630 family transposase [Planctomycetales bacterium]
MRRAVTIKLTEDQRQELTQYARSRIESARLVSRAKMILLAAEGLENQEIAEQLGLHRVTVANWRRRFAAEGLDGIKQERPGRGRKATKRRHWARRIIDTTLHSTPSNATHWSQRSLAAHLGVNRSMVQRVWKEHRIRPHRVKAFKLSTDKRFVEKLVDVVGLYLRPPEHAVVLSVDEKSQIQALDRTQRGLPLIKGRCGTMTHDYKRHGTTTLFAAIEMATGKLIGQCMKRHRHQEWLKFLKLIDAETPAHLDLHLILDNYSTHKHARVKAWLERHPRFHIHFIPTSSSWLNVVERWFREITVKRIRRGTFLSVAKLEEAIYDYIEQHNEDPRPFIWTANLDTILPKIVRAHQALDKANIQ